MTQSAIAPLHGRPVIFGEVLFDLFPDRAVLGGAPFNVAWHLQGFGLEPLFISRVGDDARGAEVLDAMRAWGMATEGVQRDPLHPTGQVRITMEGTRHSFEIVPHQAYDFIALEPTLAALAPLTPSLLYHGSLIAREATSAATLGALCARPLPRFVDINLRAPWWGREAALALMAGARWLKLNDEELELLDPGAAPADERAAALRARLGLERLIFTLGEHGAELIGAEGREWGAPPPVERFVDTVGAGDAFAAVTILGLHRGWSPADTLVRALGFAARVVGNRGATLSDRTIYAEYLEQWQ